jgi:ribosomal-protein-alanine N-acetyltransferase
MNTSGKLTHEAVCEEIIHLDQRYFPTPWSHSQWKELSLETHLLFGWRVQGELIGLALFGRAPGDDVAHLFKILLLTEWRGTGTSLAFWNEILSDLRGKGLKSVYLEVEVSNKRAISFYHKAGLRVLKLARNFYSSGEDALIMSLTL